MRLSLARIDKIASADGVQRLAVENFLMTLDGQTREEALANLERDFQSYGWNTVTGRAIRLAILEAYR